jgi:hypothetical protein
VDIITCITEREDPQYNEDLRKALEADRWVVGLNTGRVLVAPRIVYGMTVRKDLPYSEALRIARALSGYGERWLVYRFVDESRNHVACVRVKHARARAAEVLPSLYISREWAEYYSAQWLKALSYWAK